MSKHHKIILGILKEDPYNLKEEFLEYMSHHGFSRYSISSKIQDMSKYLFNIKVDISEEDIDIIRQKGYFVHKHYWANMILSGISSKSEKQGIILEDIGKNEIDISCIVPLVSDPIILPNVAAMSYPNALTKNEITNWLEEVEKFRAKLYNIK